MPSTTVLSPVGRVAARDAVSGVHTDLTGARIAVLDNTKPNAVEIMRRIAEVLVAEHGAQSYQVFRKLSSAQGASEEQYREIAENYQLVITGSGDCGGCTSWSALDAAELERRGVTSVLLVTDAFVPLARTLVENEGVGELRFAEVAHPIGGQPTQRMLAVADGVVPSVVAQLKAPAA